MMIESPLQASVHVELIQRFYGASEEIGVLCTKLSVANKLPHATALGFEFLRKVLVPYIVVGMCPESFEIEIVAERPGQIVPRFRHRSCDLGPKRVYLPEPEQVVRTYHPVVRCVARSVLVGYEKAYGGFIQYVSSDAKMIVVVLLVGVDLVIQRGQQCDAVPPYLARQLQSSQRIPDRSRIEQRLMRGKNICSFSEKGPLLWE